MASPTANGVAATPPPATQPTPPTTQASAIEVAPSGPFPVPAEPAISLNDDGTTLRRPRDARLIHLLLASQGVQSYQERVPLMLMDFAYRYTAGILSDAQSLTAEAGGGGTGRNAQEGGVSLNSLRQAIAARNHFHIQPQMPKEDLLDLAGEMNRVSLPRPDREFGLRLPPEKYTLTGGVWTMKEQWEEEIEMGEGEDEDEVIRDSGVAPAQIEGGNVEDEEVDEEEFEDVMGGDTAMKDA